MLVCAGYVLYYDNVYYREVKHGGAIRGSHKWMDFKQDKKRLWNQRDHGADLYYCVYHSMIYIATTCSDAKDNIYFVILFLQLLPNDQFYLVS